MGLVKPLLFPGPLRSLKSLPCGPAPMWTTRKGGRSNLGIASRASGFESEGWWFVLDFPIEITTGITIFFRFQVLKVSPCCQVQWIGEKTGSHDLFPNSFITSYDNYNLRSPGDHQTSSQCKKLWIFSSKHLAPPWFSPRPSRWLCGRLPGLEKVQRCPAGFTGKYGEYHVNIMGYQAAKISKFMGFNKRYNMI
jgi:hypothetical protein